MDRPPWRRALAPCGAALIGPLLYMVVGALPRGAVTDFGVEELDLAHTAGFTESGGETNPIWQPELSGIDERRVWVAEVSGVRVRIDRFIYLDQGPGEELIQDGNRIAHDSVLVAERLFGPTSPRGRIVRAALVRTGGNPQLIWYWYRVAGMDTVSPLRAKLLEVLAFFLRYPSSELVALSASCGPENCLEATNALMTLTGGPGGGGTLTPGDTAEDW